MEREKTAERPSECPPGTQSYSAHTSLLAWWYCTYQKRCQARNGYPPPQICLLRWKALSTHFMFVMECCICTGSQLKHFNEPLKEHEGEWFLFGLQNHPFLKGWEREVTWKRKWDGPFYLSSLSTMEYKSEGRIHLQHWSYLSWNPRCKFSALDSYFCSLYEADTSGILIKSNEGKYSFLSLWLLEQISCKICPFSCSQNINIVKGNHNTTWCKNSA